MVVTIPEGARALLAEAVDYAGLFPPAALPMAEAVAEFLACRRSPDRWALGRFVAPAGALGAFGEAATAAGLLPASAADPVTVSALVGDDLDAGLAAVREFNAGHALSHVAVTAVEVRAASPGAIATIAARFAGTLTCWVEIPADQPLAPLLDACQAHHVHPKIRMGGVTAGAFPAPEQVVQFLGAVIERDLAFKATAGLHHALRGEYRLTYAPDSASGWMYGYLNLMLTVALLRQDGDRGAARDLLLEQDPAAIVLDGRGAGWRDHRFSLAELRATRAVGIQSFGSCSFREPLSELSQLAVP